METAPHVWSAKNQDQTMREGGKVRSSRLNPYGFGSFFFPFFPQILPLDSFFYDPLVSLLFPSNDADSEDGNVVCVCVLEEGAGFMSHNRHLRHFILLNSKCSKGALCSFEE